MPRWQFDRTSGLLIHIPRILAPLIILALAAGLLGTASLVQRARRLEAEVARLSDEVAGGRVRERELETTIARQHQALQKAGGEMDTIRYQIEAAELQLDGIDSLSTLLRQELGLPPGTGTWAPGTSDASPQGGAYDGATPDQARAALVQRRLSAGLADLMGLYDQARARRAPAAPPGAAEEARVVPAEPWPANWPARGTVTSPFGWRIFSGRPNYHTGIDVAMPYRTQVMATGTGTVVGSGWQPGYGWCVLVLHSGGYSTLYAHLSETLLKLGAKVKPGDVIGLSGSSGMSTGPHLHYEIWKDGQLLDPRPYMDGTGPR